MYLDIPVLRAFWDCNTYIHIYIPVLRAFGALKNVCIYIYINTYMDIPVLRAFGT